MAITALPIAPSPTLRPTTFQTECEAFFQALPTFATEANLAIEALNLNDTTATSTTSLSATAASKTITVVEAGKGFVVGQAVLVAYTTDPTTWMHGIVTGWTSGTKELIISVDMIGVGTSGAGPFTAWSISMAPPVDTDSWPWIIDLNVFTTPGAATGWSTITADSSCIGGGYLKTLDTGAASISWPVQMSAGTWTISLLHRKDADAGTYNFELDGVAVGTSVDGYAASPARNTLSTVADIAVASSGIKTFKINRAQVPASRVYGEIQAVRLIRTA